MQFYLSVAAFASLLSLVSAETLLPNAFSAPQPGEVIKAGTEYTVKWAADTKGDVKLILRKGKRDDLDVLGEIASIKNTGEYKWSVDKNLVAGDDYALEINGEGDEINYTGQFTIDSENKEAEKPESSTGTASATASAPTTMETMTTSAAGNGTATVTGADNSTATETGKTTVSATRTAKPTPSVEAADDKGAASALSAPLGVVVALMGAFAVLA